MGAFNQSIASNVVDSNVVASNRFLGVRDELVALILDERGMICDCSKAGEALFGYLRRDMVWQHVSKLLPQLSEISLVSNGQINPRLGFLSRCGQLFQARNKHGDTFYSALHFVHLDYRGKRVIRLILRPADSTESRMMATQMP